MPITDATRQRVIELARSEQKRNEIAGNIGISPSTVSIIAKANGVSFDRTKMVSATKAHVADAKARRAILGVSMLRDLEEARLRLPGATSGRELQAVAQGLDGLTRAYVNLAKLEPDDDGIGEAKGMVGSIMAAIVASVDGVQRMNRTTEPQQ